VNRDQALMRLAKQINPCKDCAGCVGPPTHGMGDPNAEIMFVGKVQKLYVEYEAQAVLLADLGLRSADVFSTSLCLCDTEKKEVPKAQIKACFKYLKAYLDIIQPKLVITHGALPAKYLAQLGSITKGHGQLFKHKAGFYVVCCVSLGAKSHNELYRTMMIEDTASILAAMRLLKLGRFKVTLRKRRIVRIMDDIDKASAECAVEDILILATEHDYCHGRKPDKSPIQVIVSSGGGDWFAGMAIIRAINMAKRRGYEVRGQVYGHAQSMGALIIEACTKRTMSSGDILMIHGIQHGFAGDIKDSNAQHKLMEYFTAFTADFLATRVKVTMRQRQETEEYEWECVEFWQPIMEDACPKYFTAEQALEFGLIDAIEGL